MSTRGLADLERDIESVAFDGLEANFRCVLAVAPVPVEAYKRVLSALERGLSATPDSPRLLALRGKVLSNLGLFSEARQELKRSLAAGDAALTRAWLGGALLQQGEFAEAVAELDRALERDRACSWAYFYRAAGRFALGRPEDAEADIAAAVDLGAETPAWLAAQALRGLLLSQAGRFEKALESLGAVISARVDEAWPYALRAKVRKAMGDRNRCLDDLDRAVNRGPAPWIYLERSHVHEELGHINEALADADRAIAGEGPQAELFLWRAHLQVCRRHYHLAVPDYTKALELEPQNARAYAGRAMVHCIRNDMESALEDMTKAEEVSGKDPALGLERLRVQIYAGRLGGAARQLNEIAKSHPELVLEAAFLKGCAELKARRFARSAAAFGRAFSSGGGTDFDRKVSFHRTVARALAPGPIPAPKRAARGSALLYICGLGIRPPYTASLETFRAISACDFIFNNLSEPEIAGLLWLLAPRCEPTMFDVRGADSRWTKTIFRHIRPGRTVGFVTRGHPLVCGGLAGSLIEECGKAGVEYRIFGSVSSMNTLAIGALPEAARGFWGQQVMDYSTLFNEGFRLETRAPAVVYFNATVQEMPRRTYERFCSVLEGLYSPRHPCYYYGRNFSVSPDLIELRALRGYHGGIDPSHTLLIPPKEAS